MPLSVPSPSVYSLICSAGSPCWKLIGDRPDLLGLREPLGNAVNDEDLGSAAQQRRVSGHQADRPGAVDRDALSGRDLASSLPW